MRPNSARLALMCPLLLVAACDETIAGPENPPIADVSRLDERRLAPPDVVHFNPQPEPPAQLMTTTVHGPLDDVLVGGYRGDRVSGDVRVETIWSAQRDNTLHVAQRWTFFPPDPIQPADPNEPFVVELRGVVDLSSGAVRLSGASASGYDAWFEGRATFDRGGATIAGEITLNPQPEPPSATTR